MQRTHVRFHRVVVRNRELREGLMVGVQRGCRYCDGVHCDIVDRSILPRLVIVVVVVVGYLMDSRHHMIESSRVYDLLRQAWKMQTRIEGSWFDTEVQSSLSLVRCNIQLDLDCFSEDEYHRMYS